MKIGFFGIEKWEKKLLQKAFPKDKLVFSSGKLSAKNARKYKDLDVASVFVYSKVDKELLSGMSKLKLLVTRSTGFDHIDLKACKSQGVIVGNVPTYGANTVAEHTFALILGLSRKLVECVERTREGSFDLKGLRGFDLRGKTIGVVGCGNIGQHVVRMAYGFEMNILLFDVKKNKRFAKKYGAKYVSFKKLLSGSDIITFHVPLIPATKHLINMKNINGIKKGAILINTSRGEVVSTRALLKALRKNILSGAGLDVVEGECELKEEKELLSKHFAKTCDSRAALEGVRLLKMPQVLVTPHNAFNTNEALMRILEVTIENIKGFKKGKKINMVKC
ncbi:hydroxyacid dehydrogenase [Candidatus Woesearchaeota archaeon]|nr:hydroxyacid dehydrogenase [Candidatus Woesearchaeota archaeon]